MIVGIDVFPAQDYYLSVKDIVVPESSQIF
jgi:hypothetical protein